MPFLPMGENTGLVHPANGLGEGRNVLQTPRHGKAWGEISLKITIDVDRLLKEGCISSEEFTRLKSLLFSGLAALGIAFFILRFNLKGKVAGPESCTSLSK
jgi:hypothetical protein